MPDDISAQIAALQIPIQAGECIGDTRDRINNSIIYLGEQADLTNETLALTADSAQRQLNRHETRINELSAPLRGDIISAPWSTQNRFLSTVYNNVVPSNKGGAGSQIGLLSANGAGVVVGLENTPFGYNNQAADPKPAAIVTYGYMDQLLTSDYAPLTALNKEIVDRYNEDVNLTNTKIQIPVGNHWPNSIPTAGFILTYDPTSNKTDKWVPRTPANPPLVGDIVSTNFITTYNNVVPANKGGAGSVNGILSANGAGFVSPAIPSVDYLVPTDLSPYALTVSLSSYLTVIKAQQTYTPLVDWENVKRSWIKNPLVNSNTELLYNQTEINAGGINYGVPGQLNDALTQDNVLTLTSFTSGSAPYYSYDAYIKNNEIIPNGFVGLSGWNWISRKPKAPSLTGAISSVGGYGTTAFSTSYAQVVPSNKGGAGTINGMLKANGSGVVSRAIPGTDYFQPPLPVNQIQIDPNARNNSLIKYDDYQKTWRIASPEDEPFAEVNFIYGLAKQEAGWYSGCAYSERRVIAWGQLDGKGVDDHFKFSQTNSKNIVEIPHNYTYIPFHTEYSSNGNTGNNIHFFDVAYNRKARIKDMYWNWSCAMAWVRNEDHGGNALGLLDTATDFANGPKGSEDTIWVMGTHNTYVPGAKSSINSSLFNNPKQQFANVKFKRRSTAFTNDIKKVYLYIPLNVTGASAQIEQILNAPNGNKILQIESSSTLPYTGLSSDLKELAKPTTGVKQILNYTKDVANGLMEIICIDEKGNAINQDIEGLATVTFGVLPNEIVIASFTRAANTRIVTVTTVGNHGLNNNNQIIVTSLNFDNVADFSAYDRPAPSLATVTKTNNTQFTFTDTSPVAPANVTYAGTIIFKKQTANTQAEFQELQKQQTGQGFALNQFEYRVNGKEEYISSSTGSIGLPGNGGGVKKQTCGFVQVKLPGFPRVKRLNKPGHPLHNKWIREEVVKIQCKTDPGIPEYLKNNSAAIAGMVNLPLDDPLKKRAELYKQSLDGAGQGGTAISFSNYHLWGVLTNFGNLYVWGRSRDGCFGLGLKGDSLVDLQINSPTLVGEVDVANDESSPSPINRRNFAGSVVDFEFTSAEFDATTMGIITVKGYDEENWPDIFPTEKESTFPHRALFFAGDNKNFQLGGGIYVPGNQSTFWPESLDYFIRAQKIVEGPGSNQYGLCTPSQLQANAQLQPQYINNAKRIVRSLYGGRQANGYIDTDGRLWMCGSNANGLLGNCGYVAKTNPNKHTDRGRSEAGHYNYGAAFAYRSVLVSQTPRGGNTTDYVYDRIPQYIQEYPFRTSAYEGTTYQQSLAPFHDTERLADVAKYNSTTGIQFKGRGYFCEAKVYAWQDDAEVGTGPNNLGFDILSACAVYNSTTPGARDEFGNLKLIKVPTEERISTSSAGQQYIDTDGAFPVLKSGYAERPYFVDAYIAGMNAPYLVALAEIDTGLNGFLPANQRQYNLYACGQNGIVSFPGTAGVNGMPGSIDLKNPDKSMAKANHGYLGIDSEALSVPRLLPCVYKREVLADDPADPDDLGTLVKDRVRTAKKIYCSDTNGSRTVDYTSNKITNTVYYWETVWSGSSSSRRSRQVQRSYDVVSNYKYINASYCNLGASGYIDDKDLAYVAGFNTFNDPPDYLSIAYQYYTRLPINNVDDMVLGGDLEAHKYQFFRTKSGIVWGMGQGASNVLGLQNDCYVPIRII